MINFTLANRSKAGEEYTEENEEPFRLDHAQKYEDEMKLFF
jgi:hypothetical protein